MCRFFWWMSFLISLYSFVALQGTQTAKHAKIKMRIHANSGIRFHNFWYADQYNMELRSRNRLKVVYSNPMHNSTRGHIK